MIKYILILHLCTFFNPQCYQQRIIPLEFTEHFDCLIEGYKRSSKHIEALGREKVNKGKLAIKFECKELKMEQI